MNEDEPIQLNNKIDNRWFLIFFFVILAILSLIWLVVQVRGSPLLILEDEPPPIGLEEDGSIVHAWNQGKIALDTYYVLPSFLQHANTIPRLADVTYVYGYGRVVNSLPVMNDISNLDYSYDWKTDNTSYYWLASTYEHVQGSTVFTLTKNHSQFLYDDYVKIRFTFTAGRRVQGDNWFFHGLQNLDVAQDGLTDEIILSIGVPGSVENNWTVERFNSTNTTAYFANITQIVIDGGSGTYSYVINFSKGVIAWYNNTNNHTNGDWMFGSYVGTILKDVPYTYNYEWVDADCTITCGAGASVLVTDAQNFNSIYQDETKERQCKWGVLSFFGNNCTPSADCFLRPEVNFSITYIPITSTGVYTLRCANQTSCGVKATDIPWNIYHSFNLSGYNTGGTNSRCAISGFNPTTEYVITTLKTWRNVTLYVPLNNTIANVSTLFQCNWTGNKPTYISLLLNDTINQSYQGIYMPNMSKLIPFDACDTWTWGCQACLWGKCVYALNGNFSFEYYNVSYCFPPLSLYAPPNNTVLNQTVNWAVFQANSTGKILPNNITLYFNDSKNYTIDDNIDFAHNMSFNEFFLANWTARVCYGNVCRFANNGNWTIMRVLITALSSLRKNFAGIYPIFIDDEEDLNAEWWRYLWIT